MAGGGRWGRRDRLDQLVLLPRRALDGRGGRRRRGGERGRRGRGAPVRLVFDRQETSGCSEEVVFPDFGIRKFLPTGQKTTIEVTPPTAGRYAFTCGMSMLRGTLVAEN